jgi:hypothetical protein
VSETFVLNFSLEIVELVKLGILQTDESKSLLVIIFLHVTFFVLGLGDELLDTFGCSFKFSDFFINDVLVNLEVYNLELRLTLQQIQDLEVFFIEFGLRLVLKQLQFLHGFLVSLNHFCNSEETEDCTEYLLSRPDNLQKEHEDFFG